MGRRAILLYLITGLCVGLCFPPASGTPLGVRILYPEQVLRERTRIGPDGALFLQDGGGTLRRFVTSTSDPLVLNRGDGEFHPLAPSSVAEALDAADARFVRRLRLEVYVLPYPVSDPMGSWSDSGAIYLSPGVYSLTEQQIHYLVGHEVGHQVQRSLLPDSDRQGWQSYRELRGIQDTTRFCATAIHRDRPHEVFAEDFRVLFGSPLGGDGGRIENQGILPPVQVPGLREYMLGLIGTSVASRVPVAVLYPNPLAAGELLMLSLPSTVTHPCVSIFDVCGRRVRELTTPRPVAAGLFEIPWDGKDDMGRALPNGVYYAAIRAGSATARASIQLLGDATKH